MIMAAMAAVMNTTSKHFSGTVVRNLSSPILLHVETTAKSKVLNETSDGTESHDPTTGEVLFILIPIFLIMTLAFLSGIVRKL